MDPLWRLGLVGVEKAPHGRGWKNVYLVNEWPPYEGPVRVVREGIFVHRKNQTPNPKAEPGEQGISEIEISRIEISTMEIPKVEISKMEISKMESNKRKL